MPALLHTKTLRSQKKAARVAMKIKMTSVHVRAKDGEPPADAKAAIGTAIERRKEIQNVRRLGKRVGLLCPSILAITLPPSQLRPGEKSGL